MSRLIILDSRLLGRVKNNSCTGKCRQCGETLLLNEQIVTKHSHATNRIPKRSSTHWYHVDCAKQLNII